LRHTLRCPDAGAILFGRVSNQDRRGFEKASDWPEPRRLGPVPDRRDAGKGRNKVNDATFAPLGPVDAKIALVAGSIDGWAVWEPYVSYATLKDNARVVANGEGLTPTITFIAHRSRRSQPSVGVRISSSDSTRRGCGLITCPNTPKTPPN